MLERAYTMTKWDWIFSLSITPWRFIQDVAYICRLFLFIVTQYSMVWMYYSLLNPLPIEWQLHCFQFLYYYEVVMNICAIFCINMFSVLLDKWPRLQFSSHTIVCFMFSFIRKWQTVLQNDHTILHPTSNLWMIQFSLCPPQQLVSLFLF